jgi:ABC-type Fe3+ transport system substrate-binding protein
LTVIPIGSAYAPVATYFIGVRRDAKHPDAARDFIGVVISADGGRTLAKFGLGAVDTP